MSVNASDDRSDGMSVVIGHDFGLKDRRTAVGAGCHNRQPLGSSIGQRTHEKDHPPRFETGQYSV